MLRPAAFSRRLNVALEPKIRGRYGRYLLT